MSIAAPIPMGPNRRRLIAGMLLLGLSGCTYTRFAVDAVQQDELQSAPDWLAVHTYAGVDQMVRELRTRNPDLLEAGTPAVVGSVADITDVNRSTPFGNIIADLVRTRLAQRDVVVTDMRLRTSVKLDPREGELLLSRDRRQVYPPPAAGMICTGTYAVARYSVIVSLKLIRATNAQILAAADFRLPRNRDVDRLLASEPPPRVARGP